MEYLNLFRPNAVLLATAVAIDLLVGDPVYPAHPVRLIGRSLNWFETLLRKMGADGFGGGIALFALLTIVWVGGTGGAIYMLDKWNHVAAWVFQLFLVYSLLALHDLLRHAWAVESALYRGDLAGAHKAVARLVSRDTERMEAGACRRAAIESLSENLVDGFVSPLIWYSLLGLPGIVVFKVASTMDSMVGYKTARYLEFGWCGARVDDLMNFIPARLTWVLMALLCLAIPKSSARKALVIGWKQHAILPGPNSGWGEATMAGAIERQLLGPIWAKGALVTDVWLGDPSDLPAGDRSDIQRAAIVVSATGLSAAVIAILISVFRI